MNTDDKVAVWGCSICANAWAASSTQPLGFVFALGWVCFGILIIYGSKTLNRAA